MSEQATTTGARPNGSDDESELRSEIVGQKQEILRLRDRLVSMDAELGAAKGRLAELEDRSQRLAGAAARLEARLPGLGRLLGVAARLLRNQPPAA